MQAMKSGHDECRITAHKGEEKAAEQPQLQWCVLLQGWVGVQMDDILGGQAQMLWECKPDLRYKKVLAQDWKHTLTLRTGKTHWPIKDTRQTCQSD